MKRHIQIAAIVLFAMASLAAQSPKGWKVRADRSTSATDPDAAGSISFVTKGSGFHATNPQAAVYWNPSQYGERHIHAQGHIHADEAERTRQLLRTGVRR